MAETVDVPKIGKMNKKWVWGGLGLAGAYVAWRWYSAGQGEDGGVEYTTDYVGEGLPTGGAGLGGGGGNIQWAGSNQDVTSPDVIDTNGEWTQRAVELLSNAGYDPAKVYAALGDYLNKRPLDTQEQTIVRAALAAVGNPPVGGPYVITEQVGSITLKAPGNVKVASTTATTATITFSKVDGASSYRAYRKGVAQNVGVSEDTTLTVGGLEPNTTYQFKVAADTTTGKPGPSSGWVTGKTKGASLKAPTGLKVTSSSNTGVSLAWSPVAGAEQYRLYRRGTDNNVGVSRDTKLNFNGLRSNTTYYWAVAAESGGTVGPRSGWVKSKTKK